MIALMVAIGAWAERGIGAAALVISIGRSRDAMLDRIRRALLYWPGMGLDIEGLMRGRRP